MERKVPEEAEPLIHAAAATIARRFHGYTTYHDMRQEAYVWCLKHHKKVDEYLAEEGRDKKKLVTSLKRFCDMQAQRMKASAVGYDATDSFFYEISQLADLLPFMFDQESWLEQPKDFGSDKVSGSRQPSEGGNWMTTMVDLSRGYDKLDIDSRRILRRYYRDEWTFQQIADAEQTSYAAARRLVGDSLLRLLMDELGGASPWTGRDYR